MKATLSFVLVLVSLAGWSQSDSLRRHLTLPNPLRQGDRTVSVAEWEAQRDYLKQLLATYQYGEAPDPRSIDSLAVEVVENQYVMDSTARQQRLLFRVTKGERKATFRVGLIVPERTGSFPVIIKNDAFLFDLAEIENKKRREKYRKIGRDRSQRFAVQEAVTRGYVLCKFIREDVAADRPDNQDTGVLALYPDYSWATLAAWGWAYSIIIDWLETQPYADAERVAVTGHSRGGKTALYAGIYDERIAVTAPNSSGSGGTGSWRYFDPEQNPQTLAVARDAHPHWFSDSLFRFADHPETLPFDAHFAKVLIAPRALVNTHSRHDYWANPYGTYLTHRAAQPIFDAYRVPQHLALHWRDGPHNQNQEDWTALYDFCDWVFYQKPRNQEYNLNPHAHYKYDTILTPYFRYFDNLPSD